MAFSADADGGALDGAVALVTGGSRGIGLAVAEAVAGAGAETYVVARGERALRDAAERIGGAHAVPADVADAGDVDRIRATLEERAGGPPEIVVNAAGAFALAPVAETSIEDFDRHLAVNLRGPFLLMRAFLPPMLERGRGHLVTIGSIAGRQAFPHNGAYSASKFGVRGLHAVLDTELRGTGVRATLIEPAATDTPLWDPIDFDRHPGLPPREAMLDPGAVADTVVYALTRPPAVDVRTISLDRT